MKKIIRFSIAGLLLLAANFSFKSCKSTENLKENVKKELKNEDLKTRLGGSIWTLKNINGISASEAFKGDLPTLNFDFINHKITGTGGCNQYSASFSILQNSFIPSPAISTMMACPEVNRETEFLNLIEKKSTLTFNGSNLQFIQNSKVVLEFQPSTGITPLN